MVFIAAVLIIGFVVFLFLVTGYGLKREYNKRLKDINEEKNERS
ncbi:MAG: hypothetical protein IEMM0002_0160 [bacterium]|nr:MAG: hypothetical protein IEMM0002_0160 [bacterium]